MVFVVFHHLVNVPLLYFPFFALTNFSWIQVSTYNGYNTMDKVIYRRWVWLMESFREN
jgi:hypothetical protein